MFITNLEIENFRGIKTGCISFPLDTRMICLIGAGDSTKSTLLKAIEWILWPTWNLIASDNDFYNCDTTAPIVLRGTFTELPAKLLSEEKYGFYLRKPGSISEFGIDDEPLEEQPKCLTIQLTIDETLEPKWEVICNRKEAKPISHTDRKLFSIGKIGGNCAKDLVWGKYSVLQKYADAKGVLHDAHTIALREIANQADFPALDEVGEVLTTVGQQYGVGFESDIKNRLIIQNGSFSSSVGLFDGKTPLNQRGTGSQRLLSMGLNIQATEGNTLLLIDEIESGLEPYRLRSLLSEFRNKYKNSGQIIMTTHSPVAVTECTTDEILIIRSVFGKTTALRLKSDDKDTTTTIQAEIRKNAEAFLCNRLIVCEGKTEQGFVRSLDKYLARTKKYRMAYKSVGITLGGGSSIFDCAKLLQNCGYKVCVLMDSDKSEEDSKKEELRSKGIPVFDWEVPNALEEQIFFDVPTEVASKIVNLAVNEHDIVSVKNNLDMNNIPYNIVNETIQLLEMKPAMQKNIGSIAKKKKVEWYKRIDLGELMGDTIFDNWELIKIDSKLRMVVDDLTKWVVEND